jgi:hypothetical protein
MLLIVSDLHLGDGTTADSISPSAFKVFAKRLQETAYFASWRKDGRYAPIKDINVVLMGDILDPLHSTRWLDTLPGDSNYIRPWSDPAGSNYTAKLLEVTRAILEQNKESMEILHSCADGELVSLAPADKRGNPDPRSREPIKIKVNFHYMIGNHDWYYHLKGAAFDQIRREIIDMMGLSNPESPSRIMKTNRLISRICSTATKSLPATVIVTINSTLTMRKGATSARSAMPSPWMSAIASRSKPNINMATACPQGSSTACAGSPTSARCWRLRCGSADRSKATPVHARWKIN